MVRSAKILDGSQVYLIGSAEQVDMGTNGGLNENVPHSPGHLNTCFLTGGAVCRDLGSMDLLEEKFWE